MAARLMAIVALLFDFVNMVMDNTSNLDRYHGY